MRHWITTIFERYLSGIYFPSITIIDILEILIIAWAVYRVIVWIKNTKAWMLLRGIIILGFFILVAALLNMTTILYLVRASISVLAIAAVVVFQPELRRALEKLGESTLLDNLNPFAKNNANQRFTDDTLHGIVDACFSMGSEKTGALIVVEQAIHLTEYEATGIEMDCLVSKQVLMNIFERNTPLHDGAVIVRGDRITSAACYLPLSEDKQVSRDLGTRHRAALGMSEVSDAFVIVVSEETGTVSLAVDGKLDREITTGELVEKLSQIQYHDVEKRRFSLRKGGSEHE